MRTAILTSVVILAIAHAAIAQRAPSAADGPWSGWVQCELTAQLNEQGRSYSNRQTHTWMLTAATPTSGTDIKDYPATWTVAGGGTSQRQEGNGRTIADKWNTAGQPMPTTISFRVDLTGTLFIALRAGQLRSAGAMTGMSVAHSNNGNTPDQQTQMLPLTIDEFRFPAIRDDGTKTNITGSSEPSTVGAIASGQPPRTVSTATCSWNLVRGGGSPPPPPSGRSITRDQAAPLSPVSRLNLPDAAPPTPSPVGAAATPRIASVPGQVIVGPNPTPPTIAPVPGQMIVGPNPTQPTIAPITPTVPTAKTVQAAPLPSAGTPPNTVALLSDTYVRCQIEVDGGQSYNDHQTHTWAIRGGSTPTSAGVYDASWSVSGHGFRTYVTNQFPPVPPIASTDNWTYTAAGFSAPIAIVMGASGGATITLAHGPMTAQSGATGTETYQYTSPPGWCPTANSICLKAKDPANFAWPVAEFQFGRIDVPGTSVTATGASRLVVGSTSVAVSGPVLKDVQPAAAKVTASCSWNVPPPSAPSTSSAPTSTPLPTASLPGGSLPAGTSITKGPAEGATIVSNSNPVACSTNDPSPTTTATPGSVTLKWPGVSGAKYSVSRKDLGVVTPTPLTDSTYTHIAPVDYRSGPYQYSITTTFTDNRCATTNVSVTGPKPLVPQVTATATQGVTGKVHLAWGVQADRPTSYLVLGPGLNNDGAEVSAAATGQSIDIDNLPSGMHEWLITPLWKTPAGIMSDVTTAAHAKATIVNVAPPAPPKPPGPPPTGIRLQAFPNSDPIAGTCSVKIAVTWAPVPGATGYTVYGDNGPISARIPLTTFSFFYRQNDMRLSDLLKGGTLSAIYAVAGAGDYANQPQFMRGVQVKVAASFADRSDGVSAFVPLSFTTYPCSDGRNFPSDP